MRLHLESEAQQGNIEDRWRLDHPPPLPRLAEHIWMTYLKIAQTRGSSGAGPNPISRREIRQWEEDEAESLPAWERQAILRIDRVYLNPED